MNVLSLFDGMSCGQIALNKLGVNVDEYFASEVDKYAIFVTKKNFPSTQHDKRRGRSTWQDANGCGDRKSEEIKTAILREQPRCKGKII